MRDWKELIPGCFGVADGIFAGHVCDIERAREMLIAAFNQKVISWNEFEAPIRVYLMKKTQNLQHVDEQLKRLKELTNYFPHD
ncbi:MAG: hypothetical protein WC450_10065 [Candidatus Omnitrophota bacterium]|jgi:hypothetical protein